MLSAISASDEPSHRTKVHVPYSRVLKVGKRTEQLILEGKSLEQILYTLRCEYPDKANSISNVRWYRNKLRKEGRI